MQILSYNDISKGIAELFMMDKFPEQDAISKVLNFNPTIRSQEDDLVFIEAVNLALDTQIENSEFYRNYLNEVGYTRKQIKNKNDLWEIPWILADSFKNNLITTPSKEPAYIDVYSGGTSGNKSQIRLSYMDGVRTTYVAIKQYQYLGLMSPKETNYILMSIRPDASNLAATAFQDDLIMHLAPAKDSFYSFESGKEMKFLKDETIRVLREYVLQNKPIRIIGFMHPTCEIIKEYRKLFNEKVRFADGSFIITGGGWKSASAQYGKDFNVVDFLKENTDLPISNFRDQYAVTEFPNIFTECELNHKHVSSSAEACTRDPKSLIQLPYGKAGLLHFVGPLTSSCPVLSILTSDLGIVHESCACKAGGPYVEFVGRINVLAQSSNCAMDAAQLITKAKS